MTMENYAAIQQLLESLGFEVVYECCGSSSARKSEFGGQEATKKPSEGSFYNEKQELDRLSNPNGIQYGSDCIESSSSCTGNYHNGDAISGAKKRRKRLWQEWCVSADRELKCLVNGFGRDWERIGLIMERSPNSVKDRYRAIYAEDDERHQTNHHDKHRGHQNHSEEGKMTPYELPKASCFSQKSTYMKSQSDSKNEFKTNSHYNFRQENYAMNNHNQSKLKYSLGKRGEASFEKIFDLSDKSDAEFKLETGLIMKRLKTKDQENHHPKARLLEDISKGLFQQETRVQKHPDIALPGSLEDSQKEACYLSTAKSSFSEINNETKKPKLYQGRDKDTKVNPQETFEDLIFGSKKTSRQDQQDQENLFGSQEEFEDIFGHLSSPEETDPLFNGLGDKKQSFNSNKDEFEDLFREEKCPFE